jgi:uncharacterized membrane protein YhaH (DUF805 family)
MLVSYVCAAMQPRITNGLLMTTMSFGEAVRASLTQYATFSGRARRAEYWWFSVLFVGAAAVMIGLSTGADAPLLSLVVVTLIVPMMSVSIRRLHDTGRSGLAMLIALIPVVGPATAEQVPTRTRSAPDRPVQLVDRGSHTRVEQSIDHRTALCPGRAGNQNRAVSAQCNPHLLKSFCRSSFRIYGRCHSPAIAAGVGHQCGGGSRQVATTADRADV